MPGRNHSAGLYRRALAVTPGGVHSPVRAFGQVRGTPLFIRSAHGSRLTDVDGRQYLDFCMAYGPMILGHGHPAVMAAVHKAMGRGLVFGAAEQGSLELAELITGRLPWVEQLRFVNSGTEAVMSSLRLARAATGRSKVLRFAGCYHGHADAMLVGASEGITPGVAADTLELPLDDIEALEGLFGSQGDELAAAIIEPLPANHGLLPQRREFLAALATRCHQHGVLLIFDEVISGFRVAFGGMAELTGIQPDLVTYGKIIGGGLPAGAYGGRRELMQRVAPSGAVYQAGTFAANPVTMAAGLATLRELLDGTAHRLLEELGRLLQGLVADIPMIRLQRVGSLFWLLLDDKASTDPVRTAAGLPPQAINRYAPVFHALLANGIHLPPSPFEVGFLSTAHTSDDVQRLATALRAACARHCR